MGRARVILQSDLPYNISARCLNRERFELPLEQVWEVLCGELYMASVLHSLRIHSFVLMPNHFHLIASTPKANISEAMKRLLEISSKRLNGASGRINQLWGARHYKTVLGRHRYYLNAYKYNYFNPVKAGIVERCEDYRFSTLRGLLGGERLIVPLEVDPHLEDPEGTLTWLNHRPSDEKIRAIQAALKKANFQHVMCARRRKQIVADDEVI